MTDNTEEIMVAAAGGEYPVFCGSGVRKNARNFCAAGTRMIVSDKMVQEKCKHLLVDGGNNGALGTETIPVFNTITIPAGEKSKTLQTVKKIIDEMAAMNMRRDGTVLALGGGVVGDTAGFAAAIYMRGIRLIQIPTTLLAQVDAAVGGKTGVNHARGKNLIGAFYQPAAVFCDTDFLSTLPLREYRAGLAEVVKYALLGIGDLTFWSWLEQNATQLMARDNNAVREMLVRSIKMKAAIVAEDERETGTRRALLNLGHTFAHGLENAAGYGKWLHGEAVAVGLVAAAKLSEKKSGSEGGFPAADTARIVKLLKAFKLPVSFSDKKSQVEPQAIEDAMGMDKKHIAAETRFVLMNKAGFAGDKNKPENDKDGRATFSIFPDWRLVREVLEEMR